MSNEDKPCCLCGNRIGIEPVTEWKGGHNAWPIAEGRCCSDCNLLVVLPARVAMLKEPRVKGERR